MILMHDVWCITYVNSYSNKNKIPTLASTSHLNEDLYNVNLNETPLYKCGEALKGAKHYLKECPNYEELKEDIAETHPNYSQNHEVLHTIFWQ